ncbi:glycosyltransferase [Halostagnicola sp. A-GB9-2]|uniref:glycosyltransferase n=1 Tax=Halostagnicola sp. A-GB9-2 TaxID=3048066 RepID=UPI0024BF87BB|nr:glycosyltransferase [Halostagnicola sp. A-GB9-2]MDJ1434188.1 glycosyltransferase [Halostagnicola sp. A-GB9-2]
MCCFPYDPSRTVKNHPLAEEVVDQVKEETSKSAELQVVYGVDHEDVPLYINAADALLLTSHREGFLNSVKEAMACNLPVVSTAPLAESAIASRGSITASYAIPKTSS